MFSSGIIPDEWSKGIISPIYKSKGDKANPDNYRGITILSCFGIFFTAVLNKRLNKYLDDMNWLCQVWYLIVSIPDLCTLTYFVKNKPGFIKLWYN